MKQNVLLCLISLCLPCVLGTANVTCAWCLLGSSQCNATCIQQGATCVTLMEVNTLGGSDSPNGSYRGCINQEHCRPLAFTLTTAAGRHVQSNMACCSNELCNKELTLSVLPIGTSENGVSCPACENYNQTQCEAKSHIACTGIEKKCITLTGESIASTNQTFSIRGCATDSACSLRQNDLVPFGGKIYKLTANAVCTDRGILGAIASSSLIFSSLVGLLLVNHLS